MRIIDKGKVLLSPVATALTAVISLSVFGSDTIHKTAYNGNEAEVVALLKASPDPVA